MPEPAIAYLGMLYGVVRAGYAAGIAPFPESLTGHKSLIFQSFAEQADWKKSHDEKINHTKNSEVAARCRSLFGLSPLASAATCDRACLLKKAKQLDTAMLAHTPEKVHFASDAQICENTKATTLSESKG